MVNFQIKMEKKWKKINPSMKTKSTTKNNN